MGGNSSNSREAIECPSSIGAATFTAANPALGVYVLSSLAMLVPSVTDTFTTPNSMLLTPGANAGIVMLFDVIGSVRDPPCASVIVACVRGPANAVGITANVMPGYTVSGAITDEAKPVYS